MITLAFKPRLARAAMMNTPRIATRTGTHCLQTSNDVVTTPSTSVPTEEILPWKSKN